MKKSISTNVKVWVGTQDECLVAISKKTPQVDANKQAEEICKNANMIFQEPRKVVIAGHTLDFDKFFYYIGNKNDLTIDPKRTLEVPDSNA